MTLDQFLQFLEKTPRKWSLDRCRRIRISTGYHLVCPVCYLACRTDDLPGSAGAFLGLSSVNVVEIIKAADWSDDTELRRGLLTACGLDQ